MHREKPKPDREQDTAMSTMRLAEIDRRLSLLQQQLHELCESAVGTNAAGFCVPSAVPLAGNIRPEDGV
jgi:hypothetical protein